MSARDWLPLAGVYGHVDRQPAAALYWRHWSLHWALHDVYPVPRRSIVLYRGLATVFRIRLWRTRPAAFRSDG